MEEGLNKVSLSYITKSKFLRSVFFRTVSIFLAVIIGIIAIVYFSFTAEINKSIVSDKEKQLSVIESSISRRMDEVSSIAYNVGADKNFFLGAVDGADYSGYEMSKTLERYLVGNDFIEHLAYYRLSEPDVIYTSRGELGFLNFWSTYLHLDTETAQGIISSIKAVRKPTVHSMTFEDGKSYVTYLCPLPQFSDNPQAFVLMMIPGAEIDALLESQLANCSGEITIFDADGAELKKVSNLEDGKSIDLSSLNGQTSFHLDGEKYIVQRKVSASNSWTYVSVIRLNDIVSQVATKQIVIIALLLVIMLIAIFAVLGGIVKQYKPISNLAMAFNESPGADKSKLIDEESLLSDTFATLKGDSEQKQKFEAAYYEAEAANKAKSTFLSNMSHDIRTPMNAIVGMTEIAYKHSDDAHYVRECLQKVRVSSQYLLDILNNVLDMSRIESGKLTLSQDVVEFPKLIYGLITILNQSIDVKSQKLIVDIDDIRNENVICDNVRLSQVFMNILSNSVKFTPNGGTISLRMSQEPSSEEGYGDYVFVFSDTGIGMSPEFTKQVFETFTRDSKTDVAKIEGTGLGMAIAKSFVELMGGSISCSSELGSGTTFTVKLHMKLAPDNTDEEAKSKFANMSVLILDSDEKVCLKQASLFEAFDVKTEYALSPPQAADMVKEALQRGGKFDFVIINQTDFDKSGINAVSQIYAAAESADITYVLAAKDLLAVNQSSAFDSGIAVFVQVPLFKSSALGILSRTFELRNAVDSGSTVNLEGMRVLLAEDNKINREIAQTLICEAKASVVEAANGKEAVELFKEHEPGYFDIILMDVQMPVMNGYDATVAIRSIQREDALTIPIFAMTANTFDEDVRQVKEAGMNGHLGKPYVPDDLYKILQQAAKAPHDDDPAA